MSIVKSDFGVNKEGKKVTKYTLKNNNGMEVSFLDLGGVITNIVVPDKNGVFEDVVLGYDDVSSYEINGPSFGAPVGRYANRISNAGFKLNGKEYKLEKNEGDNCLHCGSVRFNQFMYEAECEEGESDDSISFTRVSPDGEQGFPGNLTLTITYTLNDNDELMIEYFGVCDEDTIINLTNHSYFNIGPGGHKCHDVFNQEVKIESTQFTPVNYKLIPTGEIKNVAGTGLDFTDFKKIKDGIGTADKDYKTVTGYDHNFVLSKNEDGDIRKAAEIRDTESGRVMEVFTDQPGMQLYTAETLEDNGGKEGVHYGNYAAACFETQNFPNAVNTPGFPDAVLKAGEEFESITVYKFSVI